MKFEKLKWDFKPEYELKSDKLFVRVKKNLIDTSGIIFTPVNEEHYKETIGRMENQLNELKIGYKKWKIEFGE